MLKNIMLTIFRRKKRIKTNLESNIQKLKELKVTRGY